MCASSEIEMDREEPQKRRGNKTKESERGAAYPVRGRGWAQIDGFDNVAREYIVEAGAFGLDSPLTRSGQHDPAVSWRGR